jgi:hypothetical protein
MKTLEDVAKAYKQAVGKAIYPGVSYSGYKTGTSKAFKTGNLLTSFVTSPLNTPKQIANKTINGFQLVIQVGPDGAEYGKYVHYGTYKMRARPFAELATTDIKFQATLDEFLADEAGNFVEDYLGAMDSEWKSAGFEVS